jgi:hypothetical protein
MGFKRSTLVLEFADPEFDGLEVRCRRMSMGQALDIDELIGGKITRERISALVKMIADGVLSWNLLDDNDVPVPATVEGLMEQDPVFVLGLARAWLKTATDIPSPLESSSVGGDTSLVESIPMESL